MQTGFQHIIQDRKLLAKIPVQELLRWSAEAPHVPIFHVMLAVKCQFEQLPEAATHLEKAAFYVSDRRQLKKLMQQWQKSLSEVPELVHAKEEAVTAITGIPEKEVEEPVPTEVEIPEALTTEAEAEELTEVASPEEEAPAETELPENEPSTAIEATEPSLAEELSEAALAEEVIETSPPDTEDTVAVADESIPAQETGINRLEPELPSESVDESSFEESINEADDIEFLKSIDLWEEPAIAETPVATDWVLEAPGTSLPVIKKTEIIDEGLIHSDISWLMPWVDEFDLKIDIVIQAKPEAKVTHAPQPAVSEQARTAVAVEEVNTPETAPVTPSEVAQQVETNIASESETVANNEQSKLKASHSFEEWLTILSANKQALTDQVFEPPQADLIGAGNVNETVDTEQQAANTDISEAEVKKIAEDSITFKNEFASETLAQIYLKQGKTGAAIQIYKKLMERFPEKSSYFAAQINSAKKD